MNYQKINVDMALLICMAHQQMRSYILNLHFIDDDQNSETIVYNLFLPINGKDATLFWKENLTYHKYYV